VDAGEPQRGAVDSALSHPFRGAEIGRPAAVAAAQMLAVLDALTPADGGGFFSYSGERLPWWLRLHRDGVMPLSLRSRYY